MTRPGALWRVPLAWLAAICVAIVGSVFFALSFAQLEKAHPDFIKFLSDMIVNMPLVWLMVIYLGFGAAAAFLTIAFLAAHAMGAGRAGYAAAGAIAGLAYTLADALRVLSFSIWPPAAANRFWHFFDWMFFIHNSGERRPEWLLWGVSAMLAGALAGMVFAVITQGLRTPFSAARRDGDG